MIGKKHLAKLKIDIKFCFRGVNTDELCIPINTNIIGVDICEPARLKLTKKKSF